MQRRGGGCVCAVHTCGRARVLVRSKAMALDALALSFGPGFGLGIGLVAGLDWCLASTVASGPQGVGVGVGVGAAADAVASPLWSATSVLSASPPVLFFFLGMFAALVRSNLHVPKAVTRLLSLYLLWAIGFQGGVKLVQHPMTLQAGLALTAAMLLACVIPIYAYALLRRWVSRADAAAIAASYGSVSAVTFMAACTVLEAKGIPYGGHMVAAMALMESPAIVISVLLMNLRVGKAAAVVEGVGGVGDTASTTADGPTPIRWGKLLHEAFLNGPVLLLLGSMLIGMITGERGYKAFKPLCTDLFSGVLVFFLLDLGILAARRFKALREAGWRLIAFGLVMPPLNAAIALGLAWALGLPPGDGALLMVLGASASYIAVPAAVRLMIPQANPGLYIPLPLAVTFPFNIGVGIALYTFAATTVLKP